VLDRSIFSDWVFAEKNRLDGNIDADGFFFYSQLRDQMLESLPFPHVTIYLDVPPQLCHQRIHGLRCRAEEVDSGIPLEYLEGLHRCYQQFLAQMGGRGSHVVQLPWSSFGSAAQIVARHCRRAGRARLSHAPARRRLVGRRFGRRGACTR
jgi:hypothetical protein